MGTPARRQIHGEYSERAGIKEAYGAGLRKQIDDLKNQLIRYSEALENDLQAGRDRIATRVREALGYEKGFQEASGVLIEHLRDKPECRELLEEVIEAGSGENSSAAPST